MPEIKIKVRDKCAEGEGVIICNNSDYTVVWDLDGEWTPYDTKTMRVNLADGTYQDVVFTGDTATLPVLTASGWVSVGLYAGDIHTSRAARLLALSSVLTPGGSPAAPAEDVYAQIMAKLNELSTVSPEDIAKAVEDYLTEHPAASASMRVEGGYIQFSGDGKTWENVIALADLKGPKGDTGAGMDVTGATVDQTVKIAAVDDNGVPTAWEPVDMPSGGGDGTPRVIKTIHIDTEEVNSIYFSTDDDGNAFELKNQISIRMYGATKNTGSEQSVLFFRAGSGNVGNGSQSLFPIRANSTKKNYVFDMVITSHRMSNMWCTDFAFGLDTTDSGFSRYVPSDAVSDGDMVIREIKILWNVSTVFFPKGATIVVEGY